MQIIIDFSQPILGIMLGMKVTGHASSAMVYTYDKASQETNATEKVQLVS